LQEGAGVKVQIMPLAKEKQTAALLQKEEKGPDKRQA